MTFPNTVDEYIASFPAETQAKLQQIRAIIRKAVPKAEERISYKIAGYFQAGPVLFFAGYNHHIGLYPVPKGDAAFLLAVAPYRSAKSTLRLPLDKPLPRALIRKMAQLRMKENEVKLKAKKV